jgi:hypothetical protein
MSLLSEWDRYLADYRYGTISDTDKELGIGRFWDLAHIKTRYPSLSKLGRWFADMPTSSVAAERTFAVMRNYESHLKHRTTAETFESELMLRVNSWIVDRKLNDAWTALSTR